MSLRKRSLPRSLAALAALLLACGSVAALPHPAQAAPAASCAGLKVDLDKGLFAGLPIKSSLAAFKKALACKGDESESMGGINLFYAADNFNIFVSRKYNVITLIRTDEHFSGELSQDLFDKNVLEVDDLLGEPAHTAREEANPDTGSAASYSLYERPWGTLILKFGAYEPSTVEEISLTTQKLEDIKEQY